MGEIILLIFALMGVLLYFASRTRKHSKWRGELLTQFQQTKLQHTGVLKTDRNTLIRDYDKLVTEGLRDHLREKGLRVPSGMSLGQMLADFKNHIPAQTRGRIWGAHYVRNRLAHDLNTSDITAAHLKRTVEMYEAAISGLCNNNLD